VVAVRSLLRAVGGSISITLIASTTIEQDDNQKYGRGDTLWMRLRAICLSTRKCISGIFSFTGRGCEVRKKVDIKLRPGWVYDRWINAAADYHHSEWMLYVGAWSASRSKFAMWLAGFRMWLWGWWW